jgi:hypothetical protein
MSISTVTADRRVADVVISKDRITVALRDGRTVSAPLSWYPRLQRATPKQRKNWQIAGGGFGIHWPEIDEDLNIEGLLQGAPSPEVTKPATRKRSLVTAKRRN